MTGLRRSSADSSARHRFLCLLLRVPRYWIIELRFCTQGECLFSQDLQASMQGYASESGEHSHYWVDLNGSIIDLGTYYLPVGSKFPACEIPAVIWDAGYDLPRGLKYAPEPSKECSWLLMSKRTGLTWMTVAPLPMHVAAVLPSDIQLLKCRSGAAVVGEGGQGEGCLSRNRAQA